MRGTSHQEMHRKHLKHRKHPNSHNHNHDRLMDGSIEVEISLKDFGQVKLKSTGTSED